MKLKTFSRKTIAIAMAAGMSLGGVTVAAPTAGAVGGRTGESAWYLDKEGNLISNKDPNSLLESSYETVARYPTWGISPAMGIPKGGYFEDVPVIDSPAVSGFSSANDASGQQSAATAGSSAFPHGFQKEPMQVKDMTTLDLGDGSTKESSLDAKKMYYVAFSIVNDIVKNEGLSPELRSRLKGYGYTGDFGKESAIDVDKSYYHWTGDGKITDDQLREGYLWEEGTHNSEGNTTFYSSGDYVASVVLSLIHI